jgi:hypothetical protein
MQDKTTIETPSEPQRSRAVFSNEDFRLLKMAIQHYIPQLEGKPELTKYSNLYHRLGRLT